MKIFLFYFEIAIKITGSAQNYRVGRVSGNTPTLFRPYASILLSVCDQSLFSWPVGGGAILYRSMPHFLLCLFILYVVVKPYMIFYIL